MTVPHHHSDMHLIAMSSQEILLSFQDNKRPETITLQRPQLQRTNIHQLGIKHQTDFYCHSGPCKKVAEKESREYEFL